MEIEAIVDVWHFDAAPFRRAMDRVDRGKAARLQELDKRAAEAIKAIPPLREDGSVRRSQGDPTLIEYHPASQVLDSGWQKFISCHEANLG